MKPLMTRWKVDPSYPNPCSPVARALKFSVVSIDESINIWSSYQPVRQLQSHTRHSLSIKTNHNTSERFIAVSNVEVDLVGDLGTAYLGFSSLGEEEENGGKDHQDGDRETLKSCHDVVLGWLQQLKSRCMSKGGRLECTPEKWGSGASSIR